MYEYFVEEFKWLYNTKQELPLDAPEIYDVLSRENNKLWRAGENCVWGGIGLYLQHGDILSWGEVVGGRSVITFRQ